MRLRIAIGLIAGILALAGTTQAHPRVESHVSFLRSKSFWWRIGVMGGAALADGITTEQLIGRGGYERDPFVIGTHPGAAQLATEGVAVEVSVAYLAWRERDSSSKARRLASRLVPVAVAGMQTTFAIQNATK